MKMEIALRKALGPIANIDYALLESGPDIGGARGTLEVGFRPAAAEAQK